MWSWRLRQWRYGTTQSELRPCKWVRGLLHTPTVLTLPTRAPVSWWTGVCGNSGGGLGASGKTIFIVFAGNRTTFPRSFSQKVTLGFCTYLNAILFICNYETGRRWDVKWTVANIFWIGRNPLLRFFVCANIGILPHFWKPLLYKIQVNCILSNTRWDRKGTHIGSIAFCVCVWLQAERKPSLATVQCRRS
jgi:hypothetical protein